MFGDAKTYEPHVNVIESACAEREWFQTARYQI